MSDPVLGEYCVIAAYNTGVGNVLRAFSRGKPSEAIAAINRLPPEAVYQQLRTGLPYQETRVYDPPGGR